MSVAVAPMAFSTQAPTLQHVHQPDLLELLLASCAKKTVTQPVPGFGRELQPYFTGEDVQHETLLPIVPKCRSGNVSPKRAAKRSAALAAAAEAAASARKGTKKCTAVSTTKPTAAQAELARATQLAAVMTAWAGPGFCVAPTPEQLPLPTAALLD